MDSKLITLAKKLKALVDRGVDGEKDNAVLKLQKLMEKHGFTEADINDEEKKTWCSYWYTSTFEKKLLLQIQRAIIGKEARYRPNKGSRGLSFNFTVSQQIEFEYKWSIYKKSMNDQLALFYAAFVNKNHIFHSDDEGQDWEDLTPEEQERRLAISELAKSAKKVNIHKQLK